MSNGGIADTTEFPTPVSANWLALVEKTLKGKPFDKAMKRKTSDGIEFPVLHTEVPGVRHHNQLEARVGGSSLHHTG